MPKFKFHSRKLFPGLTPGNHKATSHDTPIYNCIAWAAGDDKNWWCPQLYWPPSAPRAFTLAAYIKAFEAVGFAVTTSTKFNPKTDRIVIYTKNGIPKHAARQIGQNKWWSKMGGDADIHHKLMGVSGAEYGDPAVYMERPHP